MYFTHSIDLQPLLQPLLQFFHIKSACAAHKNPIMQFLYPFSIQEVYGLLLSKVSITVPVFKWQVYQKQSDDSQINHLSAAIDDRTSNIISGICVIRSTSKVPGPRGCKPNHAR